MNVRSRAARRGVGGGIFEFLPGVVEGHAQREFLLPVPLQPDIAGGVGARHERGDRVDVFVMRATHAGEQAQARRHGACPAHPQLIARHDHTGRRRADVARQVGEQFVAADEEAHTGAGEPGDFRISIADFDVLRAGTQVGARLGRRACIPLQLGAVGIRDIAQRGVDVVARAAQARRQRGPFVDPCLQAGGKVGRGVVHLRADEFFFVVDVGVAGIELQLAARREFEAHRRPQAGTHAPVVEQHEPAIAEIALAEVPAAFGVGLLAVDDVLLREFAAHAALHALAAVLPIERAEIVDGVEIGRVGEVGGAHARRETEFTLLRERAQLEFGVDQRPLHVDLAAGGRQAVVVVVQIAGLDLGIPLPCGLHRPAQQARVAATAIVTAECFICTSFTVTSLTACLTARPPRRRSASRCSDRAACRG